MADFGFDEALEKKRKYAREYARQRRATDPIFLEKNRESGRKSRINNIEKRKKQNQEWKANNKEKIAEYQKQYRIKNKEKLRLQKNEWNKKRRKESPIFALISRERVRIWDALKGKRKSSKTLTLLGCSYDFFKTYIESKFTDGMNWENMGKWHIDHIKPLSLFDLSDVNQQKEAFHYTNQQPLWAIDNIKKGAKYG